MTGLSPAADARRAAVVMPATFAHVSGAARCVVARIALASVLLLPAAADAQRVTLAPPPVWDASRPRADPPVLLGLRSSGDPQTDYALNCRGCHRADGEGTPGAVPRLAGSMGRFLEVEGGREYLARVPGVAQSALDDGAVAELLNWMLARFDGGRIGADFLPYTAAEVARLRREPLVRVRATRAALLGAAGTAD